MVPSTLNRMIGFCVLIGTVLGLVLGVGSIIGLGEQAEAETASYLTFMAEQLLTDGTLSLEQIQAIQKDFNQSYKTATIQNGTLIELLPQISNPQKVSLTLDTTEGMHDSFVPLSHLAVVDITHQTVNTLTWDGAKYCLADVCGTPLMEQLAGAQTSLFISDRADLPASRLMAEAYLLLP